MDQPASELTPIFILSLPRSGSTLLQRLLTAHDGIASANEPTFLMPLIYSNRSDNIYSTFDYRTTAWAVQDFILSLPNKNADYQAEIREFALRLYARSAGGPVRYFIDKTPRYALIVDELIEIFPDAKFVLLWRNPLSIIASIIKTFSQGRWLLYFFEHNLKEGLPKLVTAYQREPERFCTVRYEDLVQEPAPVLEKLFAHLELPFQESVLQDFADVNFIGRLGDPNADREEYQVVRSDSLDKWKEQLSSPARKAWCRRYLRGIGAERLAIMGYDLERLLGELDAVPPTYGTLLQITFG